MDIQVKNFTDLTDQDIADWRRIQKADPAFISPFYAPDFARAVNEAGQLVYVAIVREGDRVTSLLPFHRGRWGKGIPVGGQISDYQGLIGTAGTSFDKNTFLKASRLCTYDFNHLPLSQSIFTAGRFTTSVSPFLNLENGFDTYLAERRSKKNKVLKNAVRNLRILERDIGPVRLELDDRSETAWQTLVQWKNNSFQSMGVSSILEVDWARHAFETIRKINNPDFAGIVSSLYVDDKPVAIHFGMRSHAGLHWWFPTYNPDLGKYSPGIVLLLEVAKQLPDHGIVKLDLGRGSQPYKKAFASGTTELCEGSIERPFSLTGSARVIRKATDKSIHRVPGMSKPAHFQRKVFNRLLGSVTLGQ